jgi:hypothetical protein
MPSSGRPWLLDRAFDCGSELFSDQWFGNVVEKSHLSTPFDINVGVVSADGDGPNRLHCAQFLHQVPSGAIGQAKVTEQHVEFDRFCQTSCGSDIRRNVNFVTDGGEEFSQRLRCAGVVFDDDDAVRFSIHGGLIQA